MISCRSTVFARYKSSPTYLIICAGVRRACVCVSDRENLCIWVTKMLCVLGSMFISMASASSLFQLLKIDTVEQFKWELRWELRESNVEARRKRKFGGKSENYKTLEEVIILTKCGKEVFNTRKPCNKQEYLPWAMCI